MTARPDYFTIEAAFSKDEFDENIWSDITQDVVTTPVIRCSYGIRDNSVVSRVAGTGTLSFSLDNSKANSAGKPGYYSPGHTNCRAGFSAGIDIRISFTYDGVTVPRFEGKIAKDGIKVDAGRYGQRRTTVTVVDWMNQASTKKLPLPQYTTNKRMDEVVDLILAMMSNQPENKSLDVGLDTFVSVFDTVRDKTTALSEFSKLALSEWGYIYLRHAAANANTLKVEGRESRPDAFFSRAKLPTPRVDSWWLATEDGEALITEDGDYILVDDFFYADFFINTFVNVDYSYGKNTANVITITSYPRKYDTDPVILYTLQSSIKLAAGETRKVSGTFRDPTGGAPRVAGKNMIAPESGTDYAMFANSDGTGTNRTADLVVSETYGANGVEYELTNNNVNDSYVTKLQARGYGIYLYDAIKSTYENTGVQDKYGELTLDINMPYQNDPDTAEAIAKFELLNAQISRPQIDSFSFWANQDYRFMLAFMYLDIGSRVTVRESQTGINRDVYIDGVDFEIHGAGLIKVTYRVRPVSAITGWYIGIEGRSEIGVSTYVG